MSISDISLTAGMRANLISLQNTANLTQTTQQRLSTGKKVNSALDNPLEYFASQNMLSQANQLSSYNDGMSNAIQTIQAANQGITGIQSLVTQAQSLAQSMMSTTDTTAQANLATQYSTVMTQIDNMAGDSGFQGTNLIGSTSATLTVSFGTGASDNLAITSQSMTSSGLGLSATLSSGTASTVISNCTAALTKLQSTSQTLSSSLAVIQSRQGFSTGMINVLQTGSDNLVLADTNQEGANMLMLQTRQSLGTTALSLASQSAQAVLKLFG